MLFYPKISSVSFTQPVPPNCDQIQTFSYNKNNNKSIYTFFLMVKVTISSQQKQINNKKHHDKIYNVYYTALFKTLKYALQLHYLLRPQSHTGGGKTCEAIAANRCNVGK